MVSKKRFKQGNPQLFYINAFNQSPMTIRYSGRLLQAAPKTLKIYKKFKKETTTPKNILKHKNENDFLPPFYAVVFTKDAKKPQILQPDNTEHINELVEECIQSIKDFFEL